MENSIDLILDSSTYLIASNTLDITDDIQSILEKLNLKLEYQNFEKIKYKEIKEILRKNSLEVKSKISDNEIFFSLKTILNSSATDLTFFQY